jgi:hypothetical protein
MKAEKARRTGSFAGACHRVRRSLDPAADDDSLETKNPGVLLRGFASIVPDGSQLCA